MITFPRYEASSFLIPHLPMRNAYQITDNRKSPEDTKIRHRRAPYREIRSEERTFVGIKISASVVGLKPQPLDGGVRHPGRHMGLPLRVRWDESYVSIPKYFS